jgi:hypothetical protein
MTEGVLLRVCRAQASLAETLVEPWLREHDPAGRARLIESLLPRLLALCEVFEELHAAAWEDLFAGSVRDVQDLGEDLRQTWADALGLLGRVRDLGRECLAQGHAIGRFDELDRAVGALVRISEEHAARWPWIDKETVARSRADVAAGRCHGAREVLDALRSQVR